MNLTDLLSIISASSREDWNVISGETFHSQFGSEGQPASLHANSHNNTAAYIPDLSISMEWGITWRDPFDAPWVEKFPSHIASGHYLDVFFNHSLVYRIPYVSVDGGNIKLPLPNNPKDLQVQKGACDLVRIIDRMGVAPRPTYHPYQADLRQADFKVVAGEWPQFTH